MKCSEVRSFLSQISYRADLGSTAISPTDLDYLSANGYVLRTSKADHDQGVEDVTRLSQVTGQVNAERAEVGEAVATLDKDEQKQHSFQFHFEGKEEKEELTQRIQDETATVSREQSELNTLEANVNELIQKKSTIDQMVPYGDGYLSLTGLGTLVLNDLNVRNYRVADQEFPDFISEIKATYDELRTIGDRATSYVVTLKPRVPDLESEEQPDTESDYLGRPVVVAPSLLWSTAIGLAKLQGGTDQIRERFLAAFNSLQRSDSTTPNKLIAAEIMTALSKLDLLSLESVLAALDHHLRDEGVQKDLSVGVAATIMAGRRYDGSYPTDRFIQFNRVTLSHDAQAILAVMDIPFEDLASKFQQFRSMFSSWGYVISEDTEIASAFLAIGELGAAEVEAKLRDIVQQLRIYLEYPLVPAAILASIPVFESHEVLDLMEKAVTLLSGYAARLERSELVTLAVRMIHGVRNEIVREIDPTAKIAETPVQFIYAPYPFLYPIIVAHSSYHIAYVGMGGFHPGHSHAVGGFAG